MPPLSHVTVPHGVVPGTCLTAPAGRLRHRPVGRAGATHDERFRR